MSRNRGTQFRPKFITRTGLRKPAHDNTPTASSNILSHSYSPETGRLTVTFRGGRQYTYSGVPQELADGLEKAGSKGEYLHRYIIDKFAHERLGLDDGKERADK